MMVPRGSGYRAIRFLARVMMLVLNRRRTLGVEGIPAEGGVLLVANHQSMLDIPFIAVSVKRRISFVARDSLRKNPFLAFIIHACDGITVKRGEADRAALETMVERLRNGECVAIFPEGTRSLDGVVAPFQRGALLVAKRAKVPVVPIGLGGTRAAWPAGQSLPWTGSVGLTVGPPIDAAAPESSETAHRAVAALAAAAEALRHGAV